jgi:competence protein ComFC
MSQLKTTVCQVIRTGRILKDKIKKYLNPFSGNIINKTINNIFFPEICSSCGEVNESFLCEKCRQSIIEIKNISCHFCGAPFISDKKKFPISSGSAISISNELFSKKQNPEIKFGFNKIDTKEKNNPGCPVCRECGYNFYMLRSFGPYRGILKKLIIKFKYGKIYTLAPVLTSFLKKAYVENYSKEKIDYVDTVPDFTVFKGGFTSQGTQTDNHMQILAKMFSKETGIPYEGNIIKIKKTLRQQNLGVYERKVNLEGVFKAADMLKAVKKNILLIDDVWTTGNTLNEISKALKNCGAQKIYLLTIARAI